VIDGAFARNVARLGITAALVAGCSHVPLPAGAPLPTNGRLGRRLAPAIHALDSAIAAGAAPGAVLAVSVRGKRFIYSTGHLAVDDSTRPTSRTLYDMASLTKVIALTTITMMAVDDHQVVLDSPVVHYLPEFANGRGAKTSVTVRNLLLHNSGLPPDPTKFLDTPRDTAIQEALRSNLDTLPGARMVYSDLGAITLMAIIERLYGERFDKLFMERFVTPMGFKRMLFTPPHDWVAEIAPTELDTVLRKRVVRGDVHDENAYQMDGVSGHAGLFSDAEDLLRFGEYALAGVRGKRFHGPLQPPTEFRTWTTPQGDPPGSTRGLGWDTPSPGASTAGRYMSAQSFGHTGFTGTSIWVDPKRQVVIVLLTNRVNPTRTTPKFGAIRAVVADAVMLSLFPNIPMRATAH
jgi:CubicO group peptidase (beta-lactamase class C family)